MPKTYSLEAGGGHSGHNKDPAMDLEIQQVPWWNRRSQMERRFFVAGVLLLCATVGLGVALCAALFSHQEPPSVTSALNGDNTDYCMSRGCVKTAADILANMDEAADPCVDFYQFACGGFIDKTSIPDDRTRMSSFSVLGDQLLTQVTSTSLWA